MTIQYEKQGGGDLPLTYSSAMKEEHFCYTSPFNFYISSKMQKGRNNGESNKERNTGLLEV